MGLVVKHIHAFVVLFALIMLALSPLTWYNKHELSY